MNPAIHHWPGLPALPPLHQPILVRVPSGLPRRLVRSTSRAALREILASWSGLSADCLPLVESSRGPVWPGKLCGESLGLSLSYAENEIWIALLRGGRIGVDAMNLQSFPEVADVAQNYFDQVTADRIRDSVELAHTFATAWTALEARIKCLKLDLMEWSSGRDTALSACHHQFQNQFSDVLIAVATAPL